MTESKRPLKVFLCHAHADRDAVRALYARLTKDGVDAWLDKANLLPGQDWELEIRKAVREADVVVVCLSKQFNQAGFRQKEVRLALDTAMEKPEGEIFIIPARLEECETLESLRKWHWVDLFEDDGYEMLMRALRARASNIGTTLQTKKSWLQIKEKQSIATQENKFNEASKPKTPESDDVAKNVLKNAFQEYDKTIEENNRHVTSLERKLKWNHFISNVFLKFRVYAPLRIFILVVIIGFIYLISYFIKNMPLQEALPTHNATSTQQATSTKTYIPTETFLPISIPTQTVTIVPTSLPTEIIDEKGVEMVLVPAGEFIMGDNETEKKMFLDSYYIDKYEVTNGLYKKCVDVSICVTPQNTAPENLNHYSDGNYSNHPVVYVDWAMAKSFCEWRDNNLPTEAQWEKAARGTDGSKFPWGNEDPNSRLLNYFFLVGDSSSVGNYPSGASPYGVMDMAGNVWEWTSDWYDTMSSPENHVIKGGAWNGTIEYYFHSSYRQSGVEIVDKWFFSLGFRCVKDAP